MAETQIKMNERDQKVNAASGGAIEQAKRDWNTAKSQYDSATNDADRQKAQAAMNKANQDANDARNKYGNYTAGTSGTDYIQTGGGSSIAGGGGGGGGGGASKKPSLNPTDRAMLDEDQQARLLDIKNQYQTAFNQGASADVLAGYNQMANDIRAEAGYSGGKTGNDHVVLAYNPDGPGGRSAQEIGDWWDSYVDKWYKTGSHSTGKRWMNGASTDINVRTKANAVRQQMEANEKAMATADDAYRGVLEAENNALAKMLGGTTEWNDDLKRWETYNPNIGYGYNMNFVQPNIRNSLKQYYGYTDEEMENWANDTSHYYNFVDVMAPARNTIDESSGFTGQYAQFANGLYIPGAHYNTMTDVIGDGFGDEGTFMSTPVYDENGNIIKTPPALKGNNSASAYTKQFLPTFVNGMLIGRGEKVNALDPTTGDNNNAGQRAYFEATGGWANTPIGRKFYGSSGGGAYEDYISQMYAAALESQLAGLESSYNQNISELDANIGKARDTYAEQKRQTTGTNAQEAAAWREMANAIGLNTGAQGQAALAQNNQLQSNLNALENAEAAALTEIERQKALLGQNYQLQINQAIADNNFQKAQALYNEAVRAQDQLMQQQQFASQMALQYAQLAQNQYQYENDLALQYAKAGLSGDLQTQQVYTSEAEVEQATNFANAMIRSNQGADIIAKNLKNKGYSASAVFQALINSGYGIESADNALVYAGY